MIAHKVQADLEHEYLAHACAYGDVTPPLPGPSFLERLLRERTAQPFSKQPRDASYEDGIKKHCDMYAPAGARSSSRPPEPTRSQRHQAHQAARDARPKNLLINTHPHRTSWTIGSWVFALAIIGAAFACCSTAVYCLSRFDEDDVEFY